MKNLYKYKNLNFLSPKELLEMANVNFKTTGIKDVILWIGPNSNYNWKRIKISNVTNKATGEFCFTLTIPDFKIIGDVDETLITPKIFEEIKEFVNINYQVICDYSDYKISTEDLLENLKKINKKSEN